MARDETMQAGVSNVKTVNMPSPNAGDDDEATGSGVGSAGVSDRERRVMIQVSSGSGRAQNPAPRLDEVITGKRRTGIGQTCVTRIPLARGQKRVRERAELRQESLSAPDINLIQAAGSMCQCRPQRHVWQLQPS